MTAFPRYINAVQTDFDDPIPTCVKEAKQILVLYRTKSVF